MRVHQRVSRQQLDGDTTLEGGFPREVHNARSSAAQLALDDQTGQRRRGGASRHELLDLRNRFRRGFETVLTLETLLDMSFQARVGVFADCFRPDQSEGRYRRTGRHGRVELLSANECWDGLVIRP